VRATAPDYSNLVSATQAAAICGCHYETVKRAIDRGDLPVALQAGGIRLIQREILTRWNSTRYDRRGLPPAKEAEVRRMIEGGSSNKLIYELTGVARDTVAKVRARMESDDGGD
jgi:hypothetical protein